MELTDDRNGLKITKKSKRFCAIKDDNVISSIGAPLQTLGAPNAPLWIVHSESLCRDYRRFTFAHYTGCIEQLIYIEIAASYALLTRLSRFNS